MDGEGVESDLNIFQKELVGSLVLGLCWAGVLTGSEEAIEARVNAAQCNSLSWGEKREMESCHLIACRCEMVNGSLDLELFLSERLIPVHR